MRTTDKLAQALRDILVTLNRANQHPGPITDTIWHGPGETLFDFIENTLAAHEAEKAAPLLLGGMRFKVTYDKRQSGGQIHGIPPELGGRWVAFVAAEDDMHMHTAAPVAVPLTDAEIAILAGTPCGAVAGSYVHTLARALELECAARWGVKLEGGEA